MSFDLTMYVKRCSCDVCAALSNDYSVTPYIKIWEWSGMTYNLTPMFDLAGFWDALAVQHPRGMSRLNRIRRSPLARDLEPLTGKGLRRMIHFPGTFRTLNPPNGWGDYGGALDFTRQLHNRVSAFPQARVLFEG